MVSAMMREPRESVVIGMYLQIVFHGEWRQIKKACWMLAVFWCAGAGMSDMGGGLQFECRPGRKTAKENVWGSGSLINMYIVFAFLLFVLLTGTVIFHIIYLLSKGIMQLFRKSTGLFQSG